MGVIHELFHLEIKGIKTSPPIVDGYFPGFRNI